MCCNSCVPMSLPLQARQHATLCERGQRPRNRCCRCSTRGFLPCKELCKHCKPQRWHHLVPLRRGGGECCVLCCKAGDAHLCSGNTTNDLNSQVFCAGNGDSCANARVPAPLLSSTTVKFSGFNPKGFILQHFDTDVVK